MSENLSLSERLMAALSEHLNESGQPGIITGFTVFAEIMDLDGHTSAMICCPESQSNSRSLGHIAYLDEAFRDAVRGDLVCFSTEDDE